MPLTAVSHATRWPRLLKRWGPFVVGLVVLLLLSDAISQLAQFPDNWNLGLRTPLNEFKRWVVVSRDSYWLFVFFFEPFSTVIDFCLRRIEDVLLWFPWPVVIIALFLLAERIGGLRLGLLTTACLVPMGLFGLWTESMQTLSLMVTAVLFSLALGIPLGILSAQNDRVEQLLRPVLDAMQTMPAFVYLIPVLLFFGVARVPSIIATVIYALPPAIRLTNLGLRAVAADVLEAAQAFGATERQILRKVRLPLALPAIMVGVNQTIMMALSMVVIAALIGAGGLGDVVLKSLRRLRVGSALEAGLAIVLLAIFLDRLTQALSQRDWSDGEPAHGDFRLFGQKWQGNRIVAAIELGLDEVYRIAGTMMDWTRRGHGRFWPYLSQSLFLLGGVLLLSLGLRAVGVDKFPTGLRVNLSPPVEALVSWMQINLYDIGGSGIGTGPLRDFLIIQVFQPLNHFLADQLPWLVLIFSVGYLGWLAATWRLALQAVALMSLIGLVGMWSPAMDTLGQTMVAVLICILLGLPLGIAAAHHDRLDRFLRPALDFLQTIPIFVYLVPVIMLFGAGSVAGLIASVLYAAVPVTRLTNAGIRGVDKTVQETAVSFGATRWQTLLKVELPLAFPAVMLGINQTIMMVLAMVIVAGLVGATGLGLEVYQGFANDNLGRSVEAGLAIVLLAIVIDRITEKLASRAQQMANLV